MDNCGWKTIEKQEQIALRVMKQVMEEMEEEDEEEKERTTK